MMLSIVNAIMHKWEPLYKLRSLEAQKAEAENLQIVQLVRAMHLTPAELSALLAGGEIPGIATVPAEYENEEDSDNEE